MQADTPVGIIGLGLMGVAFSERLIGAGIPVIGFDNNPASGEKFRPSVECQIDAPAPATHTRLPSGFASMACRSGRVGARSAMPSSNGRRAQSSPHGALTRTTSSAGFWKAVPASATSRAKAQAPIATQEPGGRMKRPGDGGRGSGGL